MHPVTKVFPERRAVFWELKEMLVSVKEKKYYCYHNLPLIWNSFLHRETQCSPSHRLALSVHQNVYNTFSVLEEKIIPGFSDSLRLLQETFLFCKWTSEKYFQGNLSRFLSCYPPAHRPLQSTSYHRIYDERWSINNCNHNN